MTSKKHQEQGLKSLLLKASAASLGLRIFQAFIGLAISITLAPMLGPDGIGAYGSTIAIITLMAIPVTAGISRFLGRQIAVLDADENYSEMRGLLLWGNISSLLYGIAASGIVALFIVCISIPDTAAERYLLAAVPLLPVVLLVSTQVSTLSGLRRVVSAQAFEPFRNILLLSCLVLLGYSAVSVTPELALKLFAACSFVGLIGLAVMVRWRLPGQVRLAGTEMRVKAWLKAAVPFACIGSVMIIMSQIDIIMVRFLSGAEDAGYFQVAYQLSALVLFGLNAVTLTASPYFTRLHRQGDDQRLQVLAIRTSQASLAFAVLCSIIIWLFGSRVISTVYGPEFASAGFILSLMCGANIIQASTGASGPLLTMTGNEYATLRAAVLALIVKVVSNLLLIPLLGSTGAGISLILAMSTLNWMYWLAARKSVNINTFAFCARK